MELRRGQNRKKSGSEIGIKVYGLCGITEYSVRGPKPYRTVRKPNQPICKEAKIIKRIYARVKFFI